MPCSLLFPRENVTPCTVTPVFPTADRLDTSVSQGNTDQAIQGKLRLLLKQNAPISGQTERKLRQCILAALDTPGSLFRCILMYRSMRAQGLSEMHAGSNACALEYFHGASLLLDDLPLMDDSAERRGRICPHLLHGEGIAILAALALITKAYGLLGECISSSGHDQQAAAHRLIERCLGGSGVINGQARDLSFSSGTHGCREVKQIALLKTAPLIELAILLPAVIAGGGPATARRKLRRLAICWGLLYQAIDDIADLTASTASIGKTTRRDAALGRPNVALHHSPVDLERYLERLMKVSQGCIDALVSGTETWRFLQSFQDALAGHRLGSGKV
jgi:geranylgeranyl diphosphate synthase type II